MREFVNMPSRVKKLPLSEKGFPIPYFAAFNEVTGKRDFRMISEVKMASAIRHDKCWVCGEKLGTYKAFVIGPMCAINRTISDPPSHKDCATFSAINCPFLSSPTAKRNERDPLPSSSQKAAGLGLKRNPTACAVWVTKSYRTFSPPGGGVLFEIGDPEEVLWFSKGVSATIEQVQHSIDTGLPKLRELCDVDGPAAHAELDRRIISIQPLLPSESSSLSPSRSEETQ